MYGFKWPKMAFDHEHWYHMLKLHTLDNSNNLTRKQSVTTRTTRIERKFHVRINSFTLWMKEFPYSTFPSSGLVYLHHNYHHIFYHFLNSSTYGNYWKYFLMEVIKAQISLSHWCLFPSQPPSSSRLPQSQWTPRILSIEETLLFLFFIATTPLLQSSSTRWCSTSSPLLCRISSYHTFIWFSLDIIFFCCTFHFTCNKSIT